MYYDLNVPWTSKDAELQRKISFLTELGYSVLALTHNLIGSRLPSSLTSPIPSPLPFPVSPKSRIIRRLTLTLIDSTVNYRLKELSSATSGYDILALRPTDEKTLQQACLSLDCDIISLDLSIRYPFHFQFKMFSAAIARGIRIELCYGPGITGDADKRRKLIENAAAIIRVTRGRGLIISSEAYSVLACRGPADIVNLAAVWGLGQERGVEAVTTEARKVVVAAAFKRSSYRGVVDVVYGGEKPEKATTTTKKGEDVKVGSATGKVSSNKRKAVQMSVATPGEMDKPVSKRQMKRDAAGARKKQTEDEEQTGKSEEKMDTEA